MCKVTNNFKLCSCATENQNTITHNKKSRRNINSINSNNPSGIIWTLFKYDGEHYLGLDGMMILPTDKLDNIISAEFIERELNIRNCFDFDYFPCEKDYLKIQFNEIKSKSLKNGTDYLSYVFENGKWTSGFFNAFYDKVVVYKNGILKLD